MSEIKDYRELRRDLQRLRDDSAEFYKSLNLGAFKEQLAKLEKETHAENFWQNVEKATLVNQDISRLKRRVEPWDILRRELDDACELIDIALEEDDNEVLADIAAKSGDFQKRFDKLETLELLSGEDDTKNAFHQHPPRGGRDRVPGLGQHAPAHVPPLG